MEESADQSQRTSRVEREKAFHDTFFANNHRRPIVAKYYSIDKPSTDAYESLIFDDVTGKRVLEYGCGPGSKAYALSEAGADVVGIDISETAIELARAQNPGTATLQFREMNAEALEFPAHHFDLICGTGILHHLDLNRALDQIRRTLKPGGRAIFIEPLGHNPAINAYRAMTPKLRTADEAPLRKSDFKLADQYFGSVQQTPFHLLTPLAVPFRRLPGFEGLVNALRRSETALFRTLPVLRWWGWMSVIELSHPVQTSHPVQSKLTDS